MVTMVLNEAPAMAATLARPAPRRALLRRPAARRCRRSIRLIENAEIDLGLVQQRGEGLRDLLIARIEGGVIADEPQHVHRFLAGVLDRKGQRLAPGAALALGLAERIAGLVNGLQGLGEQRVHGAVLDQLAPHLHDDGHVLDGDRTNLDAGHAGAAGPQGLHGHLAGRLAVHVELRRVGKGARFERRLREFAQAQDHIARRQRRTDGARRTGFVAAAAFGAGIEIEQLLPVEVGDLGDARLLLRFGDSRQPLRRQGSRTMSEAAEVKICLTLVNGIRAMKQRAR